MGSNWFIIAGTSKSGESGGLTCISVQYKVYLDQNSKVSDLVRNFVQQDGERGDQSLNKYKSINQIINQSFNQSIIDLSINQLINKSRPWVDR